MRALCLSLYRIRQAAARAREGGEGGGGLSKAAPSCRGLLGGDGKQQALGLGRLVLPGQARAPCAWTLRPSRRSEAEELGRGGVRQAEVGCQGRRVRLGFPTGVARGPRSL